ncbi:M48 family metalloprotease [bacterium SCSIO 12741]|nr:M48 family metalloprotease [bacterium SCSIO 12741]
MKNLAWIVLFSFSFLNCIAQNQNLSANEYEADQLAKEAAAMVLYHIGLPQNFSIVQKDVPNVVAYTKGSKRYIGYNPNFILRLRNQAQTDWSAYSVLAHEIGHHLAGHTVKPGKTNPGYELEADHFSGYILHLMGATLEEAQSALRNLRQIDGVADTILHPMIESRIQALTEGWMQSAGLRKLKMNERHQARTDYLTQHKIIYRFQFKGDENVYYLNKEDQLIWFSSLGSPLVVGKKEASEAKGYLWMITMQDESYGVDKRGNIWAETNLGLKLKAGKLSELASN